MTVDFPGGTVGRIRLPLQGTGSDPWPGKIRHATEQLSVWATTTKPALESPRSATREANAEGEDRARCGGECSTTEPEKAQTEPERPLQP